MASLFKRGVHLLPHCAQVYAALGDELLGLFNVAVYVLKAGGGILHLLRDLLEGGYRPLLIKVIHKF